MRWLIVVKLSDNPTQARVHVPWDDIAGKTLRLVDALSDTVYERNGDEIRNTGLYVDLGPWMFHLFKSPRP